MGLESLIGAHDTIPGHSARAAAISMEEGQGLHTGGKYFDIARGSSI